MRPGQQHKRSRGRGSNNNGSGNFNRKNLNPLTRSYDSSGPDIKIRGTAQHIAEKYSTLGRDAMSSGDYVTAENHFQHAEHYNRVIAAAQAQIQERLQREERVDCSGNEEKTHGEDEACSSGNGSQEFAPKIEITAEDRNSPQPVVEDRGIVTTVEKDVPVRRNSNTRRRKPSVRSSHQANQNNFPINSEESPVVEEKKKAVAFISPEQ